MNRMIKHKRRFFLGFVAMLALLLTVSPLTAVSANTRNYITDYESYSYDERGNMIPSPEAYKLERSINANTLGVSSLSNMSAVFVSEDRIYIAASNAIHITDLNFNLIDTLDEFELNGEIQSISSPGDVFVDANGNIYVTEPGKARILLFGSDLKLIRAMGKPQAVGLESVKYEPTKLVVDRVGRMFVVSRNVYEGIMELSPMGGFTRYYGVNNVRFNPLELFWRSIATEAQRANMQLWLPTDFSNVSINPDGFIFATVQSGAVADPIKLLNSKGEDILRYPTRLRPRGDFEYLDIGSSFISIDNNQYGSYIALDTNRDRVFAYNNDGYLLYVFGGNGNQEGKFQNPVDVKYLGSRILVVDSLAQSIEVFEPTYYGDLINRAVEADMTDEADLAAEYWTEVAQMNPQYSLAYISMGDAAYRQGQYEDAQTYYKLGGYRSGYSDAKEQTRADWLDENITLVLIVLLAIVLLLTWSLLVKPNLEERRQRKLAEQKGGKR